MFAGETGHTAFITIKEVEEMSFQNKNQCIHCSVESCRHHSQNGLCQLDSIQVKPSSHCTSGGCDESQCGSYHAK